MRRCVIILLASLILSGCQTDTNPDTEAQMEETVSVSEESETDSVTPQEESLPETEEDDSESETTAPDTSAETEAETELPPGVVR